MYNTANFERTKHKQTSLWFFNYSKLL